MRSFFISSILVIITSAMTSMAHADTKSCQDLRASRRHINRAIETLERHHEQAKWASIINILRSARTNLDADKTKLGCK